MLDYGQAENYEVSLFSELGALTIVVLAILILALYLFGEVLEEFDRWRYDRLYQRERHAKGLDAPAPQFNPATLIALVIVVVVGYRLLF